MSFVQVDSSVRANRKFLRAGPAASWLWLCANAYSQETLTDGFIPFEAVRYLGVENPKPLIPKLVAAGLWDVVEGGWLIHDYLEYNKSASEIKHLKDSKRGAGKRGGDASAASRQLKQVLEPSASTTEGSRPENLLQQTGNPSTPTPASTPTSTATPVRRAPLIDQREHRNHAQCGRVCLHASLFGEFVRRRNHDGADREIRDWALGVETDWSLGVHQHQEPGEPFAFWRARYDEQWPAAPKVDSRVPQWAR